MHCKPIGILLIVLSFGLSCQSRANRTAPASLARDEVVVLKPIEAILHQHEDRVADAKQTLIRPKTSTADPFQHAQFINEKAGWASTSKLLYRTSDGGATWERLAFQSPKDSHISSFFFINEFQGWLTVVKQIHNERYGLGNSSQILVSNDAGKTWREQVNLSDEVRIKEVSFANGSNGLAVGARVVDQPVNQGPPYEEFLILSTEDGGGVWTDVSEKVKAAIESGSGSVNDCGWTIHWSTSTQAYLLTRNGRVLYTSDRGKTWKSIVRLRDERPQGIVSSTTYYKLIFDSEKRVQVIGGAIGDEGYWGDLVVNREDASWTAYELIRTPILDAVFLSKNEVLACGVEIRPPDDRRILPAVGIVLRSIDGGKSWTPIYRSKIKETFISITKVRDREFYAISDAGSFVRLFLN